MATIKDIKFTPSGIYATAIRGGDESIVTLSDKLPRWDYLNSGSYIEITNEEWAKIRSGAAK